MKLFNQLLTKIKNLKSKKYLQQDYLLSPETLIEQANQGQFSSKFLVAYGMLEGRFGFTINIKEGSKILGQLKGDTLETPASCAVAYQYIQARSCKKALLYLSKVEEEFYIPGLYLLIKTKYLMCLEGEVKNGFIDKLERKNIVKLSKICCQNNYSPAIGLLGRFYLDGWGVRQNTKKGLKLLKMAANKGDCPAKYYLAMFYEGEVSNKSSINLEEAKKWCVKAAEQGLTEAIEKLKQKERFGKVLEWPVNNLEKMLKFAIRKSNLRYPKHKWELLVDGNKLIVNEIGKDVVFTITDNDSDRRIEFKNNVPISEREAYFTLLICGSPMVLNSESLEHVNAILKTANDMNKIFTKESLKPIVKISSSMLDKYKSQWNLLDDYPIVKQAFKEQVLLSAITALNNEPDLKGINIKIDFNDCSLIVFGRASFDSQKQLAMQCLESLPGVKAVINNIQVAPNSSNDLKTSVIKEFEENQIDFNHIVIEVEDKTVILKGEVANWSEMDKVVSIAYLTPGVKNVDNQLIVISESITK